VRVAVIINPIAGVGGSLHRARRRAEQAMDALLDEAVEPEVSLTERRGQALELARGAVERGARLVVAWGGDGTVNEVASALAHGPAAMGIIPGGSGNGLARMLGMPADPAKAIRRLVHGADRLVDLGDANGRLFANLAGVGFDAHVAHRFAQLGTGRRGFLRYAGIVLGELGRYEAQSYDVELNDEQLPRERAFLVSFANGRQWGNGAIIAPDALIDDGLLDAVIACPRSRRALFATIPRLFLGSLAGAPGVRYSRVSVGRVSASHPLTCHVDGEPMSPGNRLEIRVRPGALRLRS
jgi:diacylglycerol kinase (ATP)